MATNKLYYTVTIYKTLEYETAEPYSNEAWHKAHELAKTLPDVDDIPKGEERCRGCDELIDQTTEHYSTGYGCFTEICYLCAECGKNVNKVAVCPREYDEI